MGLGNQSESWKIIILSLKFANNYYLFHSYSFWKYFVLFNSLATCYVVFFTDFKHCAIHVDACHY